MPPSDKLQSVYSKRYYHKIKDTTVFKEKVAKRGKKYRDNLKSTWISGIVL
jgi:hypothetical protein